MANNIISVNESRMQDLHVPLTLSVMQWSKDILFVS